VGVRPVTVSDAVLLALVLGIVTLRRPEFWREIAATRMSLPFCWQTREMSFTAINPATEEFVAEFEAHSDADVEHALAHAASAFESWRSTPVAERAHLMIRAAEILESEIPVVAELLTSEMGKTFTAPRVKSRSARSPCATTPSTPRRCCATRRSRRADHVAAFDMTRSAPFWQ